MKEIIELLAECNEFIKENPSEYGLELPVSDVKIIAEALEKQIPNKPIEFETAWLPYYQCDCGFKIDFHWKEDANYCQSCGQKIDWSVEE